MPLTRNQKEEKIASLNETFAKVESVFLADLTGMSVEVVTKFRRECRAGDVQVLVIKNTLLERATKGTPFEAIGPHLEGPTAVMTSPSDAIAPARVLMKFIKDNKLPAVKIGCVEGQIYDEAGVKSLSELPTRDDLIAMLARALNAPLTQFVTVLSGTARNLARVLSEVAKQKG